MSEVRARLVWAFREDYREAEGLLTFPVYPERPNADRGEVVALVVCPVEIGEDGEPVVHGADGSWVKAFRGDHGSDASFVSNLLSLAREAKPKEER